MNQSDFEALLEDTTKRVMGDINWLEDEDHMLNQNLGPLFTYSQVNDYTRIRTPFLYPDGDVIDLFVKEQNGNTTITDLGETLRWLRAQSISPRRSPKQNKLIEDVCLNHGLEFFRGMLLARVRQGDNFAAIAMRAAQGVLRVADLWFTMHTL